MSPFMSLKEAAVHFGYGSGPAFRKAFERGLIPGNFLVRIGARLLRVDVAGLEVWFRKQQAYPSQGAQEGGPRGA